MANVENLNEGGEKVSGSKLIRGAFKTATEGLDAPASEIIEVVKRDHNVDVTPALVNNVRFRLKKDKVGRKRRGVPVVDGAKLQTDFDAYLSRLKQVKDFAGSIGGLSVLKDTILALEKLAS